MMLIVLLFIWSVMGFLSTYHTFKQKRVLFDDHFTMTICMVATMATSFVFCLYLILLLPDFQVVSVSFGLWIGWKIGSKLRNPAKLNGLYNGTMGGIMGTMLGAVIQNPALCNIPIKSEAMISNNIYVIAFFAACLYTVVLILIRYSFRV
ncbi:hypothetical protein [Domibacillus iocasae]|uniref:Uncharacterized protein n=1 Tax=Domibacillus iocasae TaxID=1714016 RepID=A0A1E7DQI6_9BACI|nr:hypothetical protein [Domibacillus iocasae]OES45331.1 hypothetical protein BA724_04810 [Domibacillus iocasae]